MSGEDSLDGLTNPRCPLTPSVSPRKRTTSRSKAEPPLLRTSKRTIYTAGRPPWYNVTGTTFKEAFVIGEAAPLPQHLLQSLAAAAAAAHQLLAAAHRLYQSRAYLTSSALKSTVSTGITGLLRPC